MFFEFLENFKWYHYLLTFIVLYFTYRYIINKDKFKIKKRKPVSINQSKYTKGREIICVNPGNGEQNGIINAASIEEVDEAVNRAKIAAKEWSKSTFSERRVILADLLQYVVQHQRELCEFSVKDTGKTLLEAYYGEILTTCEKLRHLIATAEESLKSESRSPPLLLMVKKARVEYYPLGVILAIIPANYPVHNSISAAVSAIAAGNSVIVKVSEYASWSREPLEKIMRTIFANRGFNPDIVQFIPGYGDVGNALCSHPGIDKILFIGSPKTGGFVMSAAAKNLTPVILELGGKDPFIIFDDAEFDHAVEVALRGVFINNGQNCLAAERIFVHKKIYEKFCKKVHKVASKFRCGCPALKPGDKVVDCGSMGMAAQIKVVDELVQDAILNDAKVIVGGNKENNDKGLFYPPTILANINRKMRIFQEEAFGPVMLIIPFETEEEVIELANDSHYGLGCSIFTKNYKKAERVGSQIVTGMCVINDFGVSYLIQALPFGGCKLSGFGRFNGPEGLREFSRVKSVVTDRFPMRTKPPRCTQYPILENAPQQVDAALTAVYSSNTIERIKSLFRLFKLMINAK
eukprot:TRINITY_DN2875_c0_g1_i1.p1 TRINITY_DN2875_c0_g1~~TRINITY_DN2875_c0_g1_i1.p1  ORF type:complete len:577 (-),score=256.58 TRINITY_DN2875_c0_g1_i1:478-2208(-)